jgi:uncharacterized protein YjdB
MYLAHVSIVRKISLRDAIEVIALVVCASSCRIPTMGALIGTDKATGVALNKTALSLVVGSTERLIATVSPSTAAIKAVSWSSDAASVTVSANGVVSAVSPGSATITATTMDGSFTATCAVTVSPRISVTGIALNKTSISIGLGLTEQLSASISPANATNKAVSWSSDSPNAGVSSGGLVTALALGTATITATTADGSFTGRCVVTVIPVPVTGVALNKAVLALAAGKSETLVATIYPSNAANKNVTWSSSDHNIAIVSSGQVMGLSAGTATITAQTVDGSFAASCAVTVTGSLSHTYDEVLPAATALQNGMVAALASNDSSSSAYCEFIINPAWLVTCYLNNYVDSIYTLNGIVTANVNSDYTLGAMNGTVSLTGGVVKEISYVNAILTLPMSGSIGIKFSDSTSGTLNLATGVFTQN